MSTGKSTACSPGIFSDGTKGFSGFDFAFDDLFLSSVAGSDSGSDPLVSEPDVAFSVSSGLLLSFAAKTIDSCFKGFEPSISASPEDSSRPIALISEAIDKHSRNIDAAVTAMSFLPYIIL